jgi:hypothetical protein
MVVFHNGNPHGSKLTIPIGGHIQPIPIAGERLQWKKAQKKLKKNIISDIINKHIPKRIPRCTSNVWYPASASKIMQ